MRLLESYDDESLARDHADYLRYYDIECKVEPARSGGFALWVMREEMVEEADQRLAEARRSVDTPEYRRALQGGRSKRAQQTIDAVKDRFREVNIARRWRQMPAGIITIGLIVASVIVFFVTKQGNDLDMVRHFTYKGFDLVGNNRGIPHKLFQDHQYWRVLTPIFLHFGFLHILFNMLWLFWLGSQIEGYGGRKLMLAMVLVIGIASNTGQYLVSGPIPLFGGMSGVVYGLFGFVWMRSHFDASSGYYIDKWNIWVMVIWFFVCFTGILPVANMAHSVGFIIGLIWGYATSGDWKRRLRKAEWRLKQ